MPGTWLGRQKPTCFVRARHHGLSLSAVFSLPTHTLKRYGHPVNSSVQQEHEDSRHSRDHRRPSEKNHPGNSSLVMISCQTLVQCRPGEYTEEERRLVTGWRRDNGQFGLASGSVSTHLLTRMATLSPSRSRNDRAISTISSGNATGCASTSSDTASIVC